MALQGVYTTDLSALDTTSLGNEFCRVIQNGNSKKAYIHNYIPQLSFANVSVANTTAISNSAINTISVLGYASPGDGGGAIYKNVGNTEPSHSFKIQTADSDWWEGVVEAKGINVHWFGATGDGSTDDSTAIQNAIDYAVSQGGTETSRVTVYGLPGKSYVAEGLIINSSRIRLDFSGSRIINNSASAVDLFTVGSTTLCVWVEIMVDRITSAANAGHILVAGQGATVSGLDVFFRDVVQNNTSKSIVASTHTAMPTGVYDSRFGGTYWRATSSQTVPLIDITASGGYWNDNVINVKRITPTSGTFSIRPIRIRNSSASAYVDNNIIEKVNFQNAEGGIIEAAGCRNLTIRDVWAWDNVTVTDDMIFFTNNGGLENKNCSIQNYWRGSGTFSGSQYDINLGSSNDTVIINPSGMGTAGIEINANSRRCIIIGKHGSASITGKNNTNQIRLDPVIESNIPTIRTNKHLLNGPPILTISAGVVTVSSNYVSIDTESAAATDDLETINGGESGMRVICQAANDARTVVLKDGIGNLRLNGDMTLDSIYDTIELLYSNGVWVELSRSNNST